MELLLFAYALFQSNNIGSKKNQFQIINHLPLTIINANQLPECFPEEEFKRFTSATLTIFYCGLVYIPGFEADENSIAELARRMQTTSLAECCFSLKGVYGLFVYNHTDNTLTATNDHSGLYKIFHDEQRISNSFLELLTSKPSDSWEIIDQALVEFIAHGSVAGPGTFVTGIQQLRGDQILRLSLNAEGQPIKKLAQKFFPESTENATAQFTDLAREMEATLKHRSISTDVTGGFDTRLLLSCLKKTSLDFELGTSGREDSDDIRIARKVAGVMSKDLNIMTHELQREGINFDKELELLFKIGDGQTDPIRFHRVHQFTRARKTRNIDVMIHGGGGEIYKDFHWLQDFPLLGLRRPNYTLYYTLRVAPISSRKHLSDKGRVLLDNVRSNALQKFKAFNEKNNVKGYLKVHCFIRSPEFYGRTFTNHINLGVDVFAPFLERSHYIAGMNLPIIHRLINGWHRRLIQNNSPELAALETTEGYTAVSGAQFVPQLPKYASVQVKRVARKFCQKAFGKSWFLELGADANNDRMLYDQARKSELTKKALALVEKRGLIRDGINATDIGNLHLGRLLTVGLLLRLLDA